MVFGLLEHLQNIRIKATCFVCMVGTWKFPLLLQTGVLTFEFWFPSFPCVPIIQILMGRADREGRMIAFRYSLIFETLSLVGFVYIINQSTKSNICRTLNSSTYVSLSSFNARSLGFQEKKEKNKSFMIIWIFFVVHEKWETDWHACRLTRRKQ